MLQVNHWAWVYGEQTEPCVFADYVPLDNDYRDLPSNGDGETDDDDQLQIILIAKPFVANSSSLPNEDQVSNNIELNNSTSPIMEPSSNKEVSILLNQTNNYFKVNNGKVTVPSHHNASQTASTFVLDDDFLNESSNSSVNATNDDSSPYYFDTSKPSFTKDKFSNFKKKFFSKLFSFH